MKKTMKLISTLGILLLITYTTILYSRGWRIDLAPKQNNTEEGSLPGVIKTGMIAIRSIPEGAKVYLNNDIKAITASDDTLSALTPGVYKIKLKREGFETWEKEIEVFPELVTDITAVLVLKSPKLEPLTNINVKAFVLSPNQNSIAFITNNAESPGVWLLPLTNSPINIFRNESEAFIPDSVYATPSLGEELWWSQDDTEIMIRMNETGYIVYPLSTIKINPTLVRPRATTDPNLILDSWFLNWKTEYLNTKVDSIIQNNTEASIRDASLQKDTVWSPDTDKFFFFQEGEQTKKLLVYNGETPLPIGEKRLYEVFELPLKDESKFFWFSDSYHLIMIEKTDQSSTQYTISLIRIDGSNKTKIYTGDLATQQAYPTPFGDKIIVLTWLKDKTQANLYAIAIR